MTDEPLSDFALTILREIGRQPCEKKRIIPLLFNIFAARGLIEAKQHGHKWRYHLTDAGKTLLNPISGV